MAETIHNILVVDDQDIIRFTLRTCLSQLGDYQVFEAANGAEARKILNQERIDLIFCDLNMPVEDGLAVLQYLAGLKFRHPIVLISAEEEEILRTSSLLANQYNLTILGVARKPISVDIAASFLDDARHRIQPEAPLRVPLTEAEFRQAIDQGRLITYFQPQISMHPYAVKGFEALARIVAPDGGLIYPDRFITLAESSDELIELLTKTTIQDALKKFTTLQAKAPGLTLSVNVSGRMMKDNEFPAWFQHQCRNAQVDPESIICELTETILSDEPYSITTSMLRLRMMRFYLSIDDFGTGYASIEQLHALPFNELKIDKTFIRDCLTNLKSKAVVEQTLNMAKAMNLTVVAEGVENKAVERYLDDLGCDICQGFLYSEAVARESLAKAIHISMRRCLPDCSEN
ncbi:Oxygen sensor protein DosP [Vibrio aerogenes CECT 7868]|uniref:Oxygen sensor protein DosP n=1 Tax=Vibrio aerogenes CECT 7868 TaxID=1216006 RepID=A0A1M6B5R9_9VIBR|nr:EAL domain-containing response regulator [Vibrio aerogenes]SHI44066.1 Oxygen sensor protein DosP [Vibrio aerogenes CECT 7868]